MVRSAHRSLPSFFFSKSNPEELHPLTWHYSKSKLQKPLPNPTSALTASLMSVTPLPSYSVFHYP
ncbi:hypothetical protein CVS40_12144 [Lucilia cuprina]|nr:hypothetical protein CVS40_12144 [Lucilia cuprina]